MGLMDSETRVGCIVWGCVVAALLGILVLVGKNLWPEKEDPRVEVLLSASEPQVPVAFLYSSPEEIEDYEGELCGWFCHSESYKAVVQERVYLDEQSAAAIQNTLGTCRCY